MRAATIHVETTGVGFDVDALIGTIGEDGQQMAARAPTLAGALHALADKVETIARGDELPEARLARALRRIETKPHHEYDRETIAAVRALLADDEETTP